MKFYICLGGDEVLRLWQKEQEDLIYCFLQEFDTDTLMEVSMILNSSICLPILSSLKDGLHVGMSLKEKMSI